MNLARSSGVLLHPTSLPSRWGVGDLGRSAFRFLDLMEEGKQTIWQMLPLTPVADHGSPYSARSLFGCNTLLLSPEGLAEDGYLPDVPSAPVPAANDRMVDYRQALSFKADLLQAAFAYSYPKARLDPEYREFREGHSYWLEDFAVFDAISREQGKPWYEWPAALRDRNRQALEEKKSKLSSQIDSTAFSQYLFHVQWSKLAAHARSKGVRILGDVPFYVLHDSADIWTRRDLFKVDSEGRAIAVGGVPPDYFTKTGQRWGNPVYDWARLEETGYDWWRQRATRNLEVADMLRLDHFRGYVAYWEIPASSETAVDGEWVKVPASFLEFVKSEFPTLPFVAEDLGVITKDVDESREKLGIPGMRVLLFAFDGSQDNPHLPTNYNANSFAYTSTHDTNTTRGWFETEATSKVKGAMSAYLGHEVTADTVTAEFIRAVLESPSEAAVLQMQDLLGLGSEARMNNPAVIGGNWRWRAVESDLSEPLFESLGERTSAAGRS
jgi:4-alpha-glucanotransferase